MAQDAQYSRRYAEGLVSSRAS